MKIALLVLAGTEAHEGLGHIHNALEVAKELQEAGSDVVILFDGAGTQGAAAFAEPSHRAHTLFAAVHDRVLGACDYCATRPRGSSYRCRTMSLRCAARPRKSAQWPTVSHVTARVTRWRTL